MADQPGDDQMRWISKVRGEQFVPRTPSEQDRVAAVVFDWDENTPLGEALGQAIGYASMLWDPPPSTAVFESERASDLVNELLAYLTKREARRHPVLQTPPTSSGGAQNLVPPGAEQPWSGRR